MKDSTSMENRILGRNLARKLTSEELEAVSGGGHAPTVCYTECQSASGGGFSCGDQHDDTET